MLRIILDTNIYGRLIEEESIANFIEKVGSMDNVRIYGFKLIRKEIRNIPTSSQLSRKARIALLEPYDNLTKGKSLVETGVVTFLADKYQKKYQEFARKNDCDRNLYIDFLIVACASYYQLDIICSSDGKTLMNENAKRAYLSINGNENLKTPAFLTYNEFLRIVTSDVEHP